jgi:hypothetical protein
VGGGVVGGIVGEGGGTFLNLASLLASLLPGCSLCALIQFKVVL